MTITVDATLYHAKWCGHCKTFLPEWKKAKEALETAVTNNVKIIMNDYEESQLDKNEIVTINGKPVRGYPTLKIKVYDDKGKSIEYEYDGKRTYESVKNHITKDAPENLS